MWARNVKEGTINGFAYSLKRYRTSSDMGINRGRISKLTLSKAGCPVVHYDRGWDQYPQTNEAKAAVAKLLEKYN